MNCPGKFLKPLEYFFLISNSQKICVCLLSLPLITFPPLFSLNRDPTAYHIMQGVNLYYSLPSTSYMLRQHMYKLANRSGVCYKKYVLFFLTQLLECSQNNICMLSGPTSHSLYPRISNLYNMLLLGLRTNYTYNVILLQHPQISYTQILKTFLIHVLVCCRVRVQCTCRCNKLCSANIENHIQSCPLKVETSQLDICEKEQYKSKRRKGGSWRFFGLGRG